MSSDDPRNFESRSFAPDIPDATYSLRELIRPFRTGIPRDQLARLAEHTRANTLVTISLVFLISVFVQAEVSLPGMYVWALAQGGLALYIFLRGHWMSSDRADWSDSPGQRTRAGFYHAVTWAALSGGCGAA